MEGDYRVVCCRCMVYCTVWIIRWGWVHHLTFTFNGFVVEGYLECMMEVCVDGCLVNGVIGGVWMRSSLFTNLVVHNWTWNHGLLVPTRLGIMGGDWFCFLRKGVEFEFLDVDMYGLFWLIIFISSTPQHIVQYKIIYKYKFFSIRGISIL